MISGVMPKRKRIQHACAAAFVFFVLTGAAMVNGQMLLPSRDKPLEPLLRLIAFLFILLAIGIIVMGARFRRTMIREFRYDGATLYYQTLGISEPHARPASQLAAIRGRAGRSSVAGYNLIFRHGPKAYLEADTSGASALIERLLLDMSDQAQRAQTPPPSDKQQDAR